MALVEGEMRHVGQRDPVADEIVLDHCGVAMTIRADSNSSARSSGRTSPGKDHNLVIRDLQGFTVEFGVLLDEWFRRREEE